MFGTSGVRGRVGETITADLALDIGRALVTDGADTVVLGRDARERGRTLSRALSAGVTECGGDVIDVGVQPTPTVARGASSGKGPTPASSSPPHTTPAPDNGIKLWAADGRAFDEDENDRIAEIVEEAAFNLGAWDELGEHRHVDGARERHERALRSPSRSRTTSRLSSTSATAWDESPPTRSTRPAVTWRRSTPSETGGSRDGRASPRPRTARRPAWSSRPPTRTSGSFTTATPIG